MTATGYLKTGVLGLACLGLVLPGPLVVAAAPTSSTGDGGPPARQMKPVTDVELNGRGYLWGMVVDVEGTPAAHAVVVIQQGDRERSRVETDRLGRFVAGPLAGGTYELRVGQQRRLIRAWTADTAPPAAKPLVLLVLGGKLVRGRLARGQSPIPPNRFPAAAAWTLIVAGAIAAPVIYHNTKREPLVPVSP